MYMYLHLGSNIGAYASGSRHLATVSIIGLEREKRIIIHVYVYIILSLLSPLPLSLSLSYPGCCTISLSVLTASSLLIFSKLISFTCSNMSPVSILPSAATAPLYIYIYIYIGSHDSHMTSLIQDLPFHYCTYVNPTHTIVIGMTDDTYTKKIISI